MRVIRIIGRIIAWTIGILLALALAALLVFHQASRSVVHNLFDKRIDMDTSVKWENGTTWTNVPYAEDSKSQTVDIYVPRGTANPSLMVLVHGGGFITNNSQSRQAQLMYRFFRDHGYACASVNYRLAQEAPFPAAVSDVKAAVRFLHANAQTYGFSNEHTVIWGESAGGYLALMAAVADDQDFLDVHYIGEEKNWENWTFYTSEVEALVDYYGVTDFGDRSADWKELGIPTQLVDLANSWLTSEMLDGYSNVESFWMRKNYDDLSAGERQMSDPYYHIRKNPERVAALRVWISHGDADLTVPYLESQRLSDTLKKSALKVRLDLVDGAGHASDALYETGYLKLISSFLHEKK